eukprot:TRINITY_DN2916_c0_g2_i1.p1 TRINITY_DN2916_c0_g2~~TRINITY_DN2916_c0_g2_i1.p1  ORF type:complete len:209 (-),score=53.81 TRINITY_DN2916_c0_g2_i1:290-844(-)
MARKASLLPMAAAAVVASSMLVALSSTLYVPGSSTPGRREALQGVAAAAAATFGTQAALADAYGSKPWALSKYAPRVLAVQNCVENGNLKAVLEREGSFKALNGYWMFSPEEYRKKNQLVDDMMEAAANSDKAKAQKLYYEYLSDEAIQQWVSIKPRNKGRIMNVDTALMTGQKTFGSQAGRGI